MTEDEIARLIARELNLPDDVDSSSLGYGQIPEWSSATHMNVVIGIEEHLAMEFSSDEIVELTTPARIAEILSARAGT